MSSFPPFQQNLKKKIQKIIYHRVFVDVCLCLSDTKKYHLGRDSHFFCFNRKIYVLSTTTNGYFYFYFYVLQVPAAFQVQEFIKISFFIPSSRTDGIQAIRIQLINNPSVFFNSFQKN